MQTNPAYNAAISHEALKNPFKQKGHNMKKNVIADNVVKMNEKDYDHTTVLH